MSAPNPAYFFFFLPLIVNSHPGSKERALGTAAGIQEGLEGSGVTPCWLRRHFLLGLFFFFFAVYRRNNRPPPAPFPFADTPVRARGASHSGSSQRSLPRAELMDTDELPRLLMPFYESINSS